MKKLTLSILTIILLFSTSYGQVNKKDTTVALTDTTRFISIGDLNRYWDSYKERVNGKQYEIFNAIYNAIINDAIKEWNDKHKKKP